MAIEYNGEIVADVNRPITSSYSPSSDANNTCFSQFGAYSLYTTLNSKIEKSLVLPMVQTKWSTDNNGATWYTPLVTSGLKDTKTYDNILYLQLSITVYLNPDKYPEGNTPPTMYLGTGISSGGINLSFKTDTIKKYTTEMNSASYYYQGICKFNKSNYNDNSILLMHSGSTNDNDTNNYHKTMLGNWYSSNSYILGPL